MCVRICTSSRCELCSFKGFYAVEMMIMLMMERKKERRGGVEALKDFTSEQFMYICSGVPEPQLSYLVLQQQEHEAGRQPSHKLCKENQQQL